jgi:biopolymer transport protein ExbB
MNTNHTFASKMTGWLSAIALVAVLAGGTPAIAQDAVAPADPAAAPADPSAMPTDPSAMPTDPSAMPADPSAMPTDPSAMPTDPSAAASPTDTGAPAAGTEVANPYGIEHMWEEGDMVARSVLIILIVMSAGSWYITIMRLIDQSIVMKQANTAQKNFWAAGSLKDGMSKLEPNSAFRAIVSDGLKAAEHHDGKLTDQIDMNEWISMSLQRAVDAVSFRLQTGVSFLASVGSVSPFVGLFGTVWGILNALIAIGVAGQVSIDRVAGPLGEALIMTAIGLAVAVPAVLAYNLIVRRNKVVLERLRNFSADVHAVLLAGGGAKRA